MALSKQIPNQCVALSSSADDNKYNNAMSQLHVLEQKKRQVAEHINEMVERMMPDFKHSIANYYMDMATKIPVWIKECDPTSNVSLLNIKECLRNMVLEISKDLKKKIDQDQTEWSKSTFEPLVTDKVKEMFTSVEQNVENFFVDIDKIRVEISGGDVTDVANDVPLWQRIADLDGGFLVDDTDLMEVDGQSGYFSLAIINFLNPVRSVGAILNGGFILYQREIIVIKVKAKMAHTVTEKINQFPFEVIDKILDNLKAKITKHGNTIVSAMDTELGELRKQIDIRY